MKWKYGLFGKIAHFRNGLNFLRSNTGEEVKIVGVGDFQQNFRIGFGQLNSVRISGRLGDDDLLMNNDLLFVRSNGNKALIGRCILIEGVNDRTSFSGFTIRARLVDSKIDPTFVGYFFQSGGAKRAISYAGGGTNISNLSQSILAELEIPTPPLPEQRKIADILTTWDEALTHLDALIEAQERYKKALMQQLLTGRRRLKGFSKPWTTAKLGTLFKERVEQNQTGLPLLSITADRGIVPREDVAKRDSSSEDKSKYLRITPGDIGYNTMRMWQGVSALSALEGIVSPAYTICTPTERIDGRFTAHFFKHQHTVHLFHRFSQGLVDDTLNLKFPSFAAIEVTIPSDLEEQRQIATILDTADQQLVLLRTQRLALDQQKRGLMQRLLTGRLQVDA